MKPVSNDKIYTCISIYLRGSTSDYLHWGFHSLYAEKGKGGHGCVLLTVTLFLFLLISAYNGLEFHRFAEVFGTQSPNQSVNISEYFVIRKGWRGPTQSLIFYFIIWTADSLIVGLSRVKGRDL
ncbi:hypothetical protein FA15DRAFT_658113 [Coprinopsis marcescibilis]|uniref:Uncharacterized protein n=1 Tax=Coprinopsis marcescibilis TaxID=230819 RepID=A0A5C3KMZ0_COPMA|nr:hypothetical protein FA15DRAFT_658113 [Coprinopsis marcescibilis]